MNTGGKNSLDLLRLFAATMVLYSHQHALMGMAEPSFFGLNSFGGAGVSIFFFLSGFLVWSSWVRDPHFSRFFIRRSLRIFPGLWLAVFITIFVVGPFFSNYPQADYFHSVETWRYLSTAGLLIRQGLPGVFTENPYPAAINGSLWTLPVEFLCYVSVAVVGGFLFRNRNFSVVLGLGFTMLAVEFGPRIFGERFAPHFEMVAFFWWGVCYGQLTSDSVFSKLQKCFFVCLVLLVFLMLGPRGVDRSIMLLFAAAMVIIAQRIDIGARLTDRLGDLSYGMYIFAFPVQQIVVQWASSGGWTFWQSLFVSFFITAGLALVSWNLVEKQALRFKPRVALST